MTIPGRSKSVSGNSNPSPDYATSLEPFVSFPAAGGVVRTLCIRLPKVVLFLFLLLGAGSLAAQNTDQQIAAQKRLIADLEKQIAREEQEISKLKKGRASAEETVRRLARQIDSRNQLLDVTERDARKLEVEVARTDSVARGLSASLDAHKRRYAEMVREAYRNYKHNNYLTYLFSSSDFNQVARRITNLREVAAMRERQMEQIVTLSEQVSVERTRLTGQQRALDSVKRSLTTQRTRLQKDSQAARANIKQLSKKEKAALQQKIAREQRLDVAIDELRKLTRGNKEGNTFTAKTSNLRLPVVGGGVKRYKGNMAEIAGPKGAQVISIYEGKVVEVKRNRITNKYDVYIAHGEYISSYANLNSVTVGKDDKVARNQQIGTIGSGVDVMTMQPEYKMVFGIYGPSPKVQMRASDCFKK